MIFCLFFSCHVRHRLTKNPRVDFISKRVEDIKSRKVEVARLATTADNELTRLRKTITALNRAMLDSYTAELGERRWEESSSSYVRVLHSEEKRLVSDMERALTRSMQVLDKVLNNYQAHLHDVAQNPLTFHTPEEDAQLATVMQTKEEYKEIRTLYSDAMIDCDAHLATGAEPSAVLQEKVDHAKKKYEDMSERLCDEALKYENIYREELSQRVAAHFTAEQHVLRGVSSAMRDFYPYTRGLTLDWQELRITRKAALQNKDKDEQDLMRNLESSLPRASDSGVGTRQNDQDQTNPFSNDDADDYPSVTPAISERRKEGGAKNNAVKAVSSAGAAAASAAANVGAAVRTKSKGLTEKIASYAPASRATGSSGSSKSKSSTGDGWDNVKL